MTDVLTPLYVRLAADSARMLDRAASSSGRSKRQLVEEAVREQLGEEEDRMVVGRVSLREQLPDVLTPAEAAELLRIEEAELLAAAERGELPARRIGEQWRFLRSALLGWLAGERPLAGAQ